ncbi:RDD family protein [Catenovulum sp. SX2]|uniref:RDD family protein n=1 Tax=Catenovulum sp. SX2 TaxID=3398614 RepID=UPI003F864ACC
MNNSFANTLPEGVSINLTPAGISIRTKAYLFDFLLRSVVMLAFGFIFGFMGKAGTGLFLVTYFLVTWGYYILFESLSGQTPGKKRYKLKVVQDNGLPCKINHIVLRNLIRPADSFPFAYLIGLIVMALNFQFKRLGDWAAGTMVVYVEDKVSFSTQQNSNISPPKIQLSTEEQLSLIMYAERCHTLSSARQEELANILTDIITTQDNTASEAVKEIAQYYSGQAT